VLDVTDGSPADKAGIRAGDVITSVGSKSVTDADDLIEAVRSSEGEVSITLVRHGNRQSVQATLDPVRRSMSVRSPRTYRYDSRSYGNTPRRIHIDGDEMDQQQMQQQMQQMREEMKRMREELDRMHDQQPQGRRREGLTNDWRGPSRGRRSDCPHRKVSARGDVRAIGAARRSLEGHEKRTPGGIVPGRSSFRPARGRSRCEARAR
jgi:membrane-associated protease RseP (regulator of RpoE activity)